MFEQMFSELGYAFLDLLIVIIAALCIRLTIDIFKEGFDN